MTGQKRGVWLEALWRRHGDLPTGFPTQIVPRCNPDVP